MNATYYSQHPVLKSVYGKSQSVISHKFFPPYRIVFELTKGFQDSKTNYLNCSYETLVQKEALTICQDMVFESLLSLPPSVLGRLIDRYCDADSIERSTPTLGGKAPLFFCISNVSAVNILSKTRGKFPFYELFLSNIKDMILINFFAPAETVISGCLWLPKQILFEIFTNDDI